MKQERGRPVSGNQPEAAKPDERELGKARSQGVRLLAASAKSAQQLVARLERAGFSGEISRRAVESLAAHRLIDEEAMGRAVVRRVRRGGPAARGYIKAKLVVSGLDEELAEQILEEEMAGTDDAGEALALVRRLATRAKAGSAAGPSLRRKVLAAVARRGFEAETAEVAVRLVLGNGGPSEAARE